MRRNLSIFFVLLCSVNLMAQNAMKVHYKNGTKEIIPISEIDSVTFVEAEMLDEEVPLSGNWLWGSKGAGYFELLTFNDDHTYTGYDNYFTYGFDTMTYGWYSLYGNMLTLQSNGFGYKRIYSWYLVGLSNNALEVMTKTGGYIYYRLQNETIHVPLSDTYEFTESDSVFFADEVVVKGEGNKLIAIAKGRTYILVKSESTAEILAYKVIVG